MVVDERLVMKV